MYRERTRTVTVAEGSITFDWGTQDISIPIIDSIKDVSDGSYNVLDIYQPRVSGSIINGYRQTFWPEDYVVANNAPSRFWNNYIGHMYVETPSNLDLATDSLSNVNPNRPDTSLPNIAYELRELPSLVRDSGNIALDFLRGRLSASLFASTNLAIQFGYSPMVMDAIALGQFSKSVDNRLAQMRNLRKYGRIRKKSKAGSYTASEEGYLTLESSFAWLNPHFTRTTTVEAHVISEWILSESNLFLPTPQDALASKFLSEAKLLQVSPEKFQAFRQAFGLSSYSLSDLWNVLPWTWAVDYFSNVGNLIEANENNLGLEPSKLAVTRLIKTQMDHDSASDVYESFKNFSLSAGSYSGTSKLRDPVSISDAQRNIRIFEKAITPSQFSILGSVAISGASRLKSGSNPYLDWAKRLVNTIF